MGRLTGLDALRGIAAAIVVVQHLPAFGGPTLIHRGYLAVDFFLLLSGFVMARTYDDALGLRFFVKRQCRLWPLISLGTVIGFIAFEGSASQFLAGLLLIPALSGGYIYPLNMPTWSIFFELAVNGLHATKVFRRALLAATIVSSGIASIAVAYEVGSLDVGPHDWSIWLAIPRAVFSYFMGVAIFRQWGDTPPLTGPSSHRSYRATRLRAGRRPFSDRLVIRCDHQPAYAFRRPALERG